jgi:hypothetical protein
MATSNNSLTEQIHWRTDRELRVAGSDIEREPLSAEGVHGEAVSGGRVEMFEG